MMRDKKGAELTVTTIILIVLGVLVLVFLIIGFSIGWSKIFPYISPSNNVDDILRQCQSACNGQSKYNFCTSIRSVQTDSDITQDNIPVTVQQKLKASCYDLSSVQVLGVSTCPSLQCDSYSTQSYAQLACDTDGKILQAGAKGQNDKNSYNVFYLDASGIKVTAHCAPKA